MHFLVSALGSAGDVHPFIAISQALQARGHEVRLIAPAPFAERVERAGIAFTPLGTVDDYQRLLLRPELWQPGGGTRLLFDELLRRLPEAHALTASLVRPGATVLVGSTLSWATRLVQEQFALPGATVHLSPIALPSAEGPSVLPGGIDLARWPAWLVRALQFGAERFVLDRWIAPRLNRLRAELRLPPVRRVLSRWLHSPDLVIGAWPAWFAPPQVDWPQPVVSTGFPLFHERGAGLDDALLGFLAAGDAPVGVTPGSAMAHGRAFFARALQACASIGKRVVLVTPYADQLPRPLPAGVHHAAWAPFSQLLPRLSALVHHGGIGTSAQALAAGIPQLVVPFAHDQFDNAARLVRLGVARTHGVSARGADWRAALRSLVDDPQVAGAVRRCAGLMAADPPPAAAVADALERLGRDRPGTGRPSSRTGWSGPMQPADPDDQPLQRGRRQALRVAALPLLAGLPGCRLLPRTPVTPMPLLRLPGAGAGRADTLVVMLPGAYSLPQEFIDAGYVGALRERGVAADVVIADAHLGYFNDGSVLRRLRDDVVAPARSQGYRRVWLVGISLGGFGALAYASVYGRDPADGVDGVLAIAPYLGSRRLQGELLAAGGPRAWAAANAGSAPRAASDGSGGGADDGERALWRWLAAPPAGAPAVYLGYGTEDRLADGHRLLATVLPADRVSTLPGGHDWPPWLALWQQWLRRGMLVWCSTPCGTDETDGFGRLARRKAQP